MPTSIESYVAAAEQRRRSAEHRVADANAAMRRFSAQLEAAGGEVNAPPELVARGDAVVREIRAAKDEQAQAEGAVQEARRIAAEEAEYAARGRQTYDHPPGGLSSPPAGGTEYRLGGGPRAIEGDGPRWVREHDHRPAAVGRSERMADNEIVAEMISRDPGRALTDTYSGVGQLVRALSTTGSSAIVPLGWGASIIDRARNASRVVEAGAETVPMDNKQVNIGRLTADPTPAWLAEGGTRTASDPNFDSVSLVAKTLSCLTVASIEFLQDAVNANAVVEQAIGEAMGLAIDFAALFGGVTAGGEGVNQPSPPSPRGILAALLADAPSSVLGGAGNGTAITAGTPWNELLATYFWPQTFNEQPTAILYNAKLAQKYAQTYDSTGQPLNLPPALAGVPLLVTNQIPSFTQGTMTNIATDIFAGDFRQVLIGQRMDITLQVLTERYAELGQVGLLSTFRGDVQLARPRSMAVYRYIGGT
jgi:HK97 family phage major capsid protein